jgi:hypothetical protein
MTHVFPHPHRLESQIWMSQISSNLSLLQPQLKRILGLE